MRGLGRVSISQALFVALALGGLAAGCEANGIPPAAYPSPLPTAPPTATANPNPSPTASVIIIIGAIPVR
jgi:hypothetical protein